MAAMSGIFILSSNLPFRCSGGPHRLRPSPALPALWRASFMFFLLAAVAARPSPDFLYLVA